MWRRWLKHLINGRSVIRIPDDETLNEELKTLVARSCTQFEALVLQALKAINPV